MSTSASKTSGRIFAFVNGRWGSGDVVVIGMAEDGQVLAQHVSSNELWGLHDIGVTSDWKHDKYAEHYPDGFEVEWVDDPPNHEACAAALALNNAAHEHELATDEETSDVAPQ